MEDVVRLTSGEQTGTVDRRRPGRRDYDNPALIALLRSASKPVAIEDAPEPPVALIRVDDLSAARGVATSLLIGMLMWSAIVAGIWALLRI
jgi:hypothetical protein